MIRPAMTVRGVRKGRRPRLADSGRGGAAGARVWALGRQRAPFIIEKPEPYRPDLLLLWDTVGGRPVAIEAAEPDQSAAWVAAWAAKELRPGVLLRTEEPELAAAVRDLALSGVEVEEAPTPEIAAALAEFEAWSEKNPAGRPNAPDWADGADAEVKTAFYRAAADFEVAAPWTFVSDGHVLQVDVPALGWEGGSVCILGQAEETFGLLLVRSMDDFVTFVRLGDRPRRGAPLPGVPLLSVNYDRPRDLPGGKKLAAEARTHGFVPGARGRVPYVLKSSPDAVPSPPTTDDYLLATACLEAVRRFVKQHGGMFTGPPEQRVEYRGTFDLPRGPIGVTVTAPPKDVPWRWGEEEPIEGLRERDRDEILSAYHEARRLAGRGEEADADRWAAQELLEWLSGQGGALTAPTAGDLKTYLLDYYPSHGVETGEGLQAIPERLDAFLAWLASSGRGPAAQLGPARERLAGCREQFLREAADPARFGIAKALGQEMRKANVDLSDKAAVDAFMGEFNRRLQSDPSLLPDPRPARRAKAFVWGGEGAPPDPRSPCPCGSGRAYKKCCRPR